MTDNHTSLIYEIDDDASFKENMEHFFAKMCEDNQKIKDLLVSKIELLGSEETIDRDFLISLFEEFKKGGNHGVVTDSGND